jgi:hypothetical protein
LFGTAQAKKILQQLSTSVFQNAAAYFDLMVESWMIQNLQCRMDCARLRIIRTIDKAFNTSMDHSAGAHGAGFDRRKQLAA